MASSDAVKVLDYVGFELQKIENDLVLELGVGGGKNELIISADGIRDQFPLVDRIVAAAPRLLTWEVIALRQPKPRSTSASYNGTVLNHNDVKFVADMTMTPVDIVFYVRNLESQDDPRIGALFLLIDNLIGERSTATKLGAMEFRPLSEAPMEATEFKGLVALK